MCTNHLTPAQGRRGRFCSIRCGRIKDRGDAPLCDYCHEHPVKYDRSRRRWSFYCGKTCGGRANREAMTPEEEARAAAKLVAWNQRRRNERMRREILEALKPVMQGEYVHVRDVLTIWPQFRRADRARGYAAAKARIIRGKAA